MGGLEEFLINYWNSFPVLIAFAGGLIAFLSPCTLPLLPVYISFISGVAVNSDTELTTKDRVKLMMNSLFFVIGFTIIFVLLAVLVSYFANFARAILTSDILFKVMGVLVVILGIQLTGLLKLNFLSSEKKLHINFGKKGYLFSLFLGMAFAVGWSPCTGPILASVLAMAATSSSVVIGVIYLAAFSLGLGIPFILLGFFIDVFTKVIKKSEKVVKTISIISGIVLIIMGILLFFNKTGIVSGLFG